MSKITDELNAEVGTFKAELHRLIKRFDHIAEEVVSKVLNEVDAVVNKPGPDTEAKPAAKPDAKTDATPMGKSNSFSKDK